MTDYVSFTTAGQLFGLPIEHVQDVFTLANMTRVPLAGREIAGVLNLRGRIVTVIDLASRLQLDGSRDAHMVVGIGRGAESFGILVDRVGEVRPVRRGPRADPGQSRPYIDCRRNGGIPPRQQDSCGARRRSHPGFSIMKPFDKDIVEEKFQEIGSDLMPRSALLRSRPAAAVIRDSDRDAA
ncbi:MAG TPA: chemotaxis protein CheW [Bradyrhizobium sp.]|nr:chemotaxis protein CheW [Bradyrhizobium sp.]